MAGPPCRRQWGLSFRAQATSGRGGEENHRPVAAAWLLDGDQVFLDSGTTCSEMVPYLKKMHGVTILTNSARLALQLNAPDSACSSSEAEYRPTGWTRRPDGDEHMNRCGVMWRSLAATALSRDFGPSPAMLPAPICTAGRRERTRGGVVGRQHQIRRRVLVPDCRLAADPQGP